MTTEPIDGGDAAPSDPCLKVPDDFSVPSLLFVYNAACTGINIIDTQGGNVDEQTLLYRLRSIFEDIQADLSCESGKGNLRPLVSCAYCRTRYRNDPKGYADCKANCTG